MREIVERLVKKRESQGCLDEFDEEDLGNYQGYLARYEGELESLGIRGQLAWRLWGEIQGQREEGFSSIRDIKFESFEFLFRIYVIAEEDHLMLYQRIRHIDHLVRDRLEKKSPPKKGAEK